MKLYFTAINTALKVFVILFCVFSVNPLFGDDEFSVTVSERKSGNVETHEICYVTAQDIELIRIPSFEVSNTGLASPTFNVTFNFYNQTPPDNRLFEIHGYVYIKTGPQSFIPVSLNNSVPQGNHVIGNSGSSLGGQVSLSVTPEFNVLTNCGYYFSFTAVDITPPTGGGSGSNTGNQPSMSIGQGSQGVLGNYTFSSPKIAYTKEAGGCTRYYTSNCIVLRIEGEPTNTERTSLSQENTILDIFPNPTSNGKVVLSLDFEEQRSRNLDIEVLNIQGQLMKKEQVHVTAAQSSIQQKLDMQEIPAGIYLIKVDTGTQQLIQKLVIQ